MKFYLGTAWPAWLERVDVPLFVSHRSLADRRKLPRAIGPWALDSGGFTELSMRGRWTIPARAYASAAQRFAREIGRMEWAAIQDWMCEEAILEKTKLGIEQHQERTIDSFLELRELAPEIPWTPVLQGWTMGDYLDHAEQYDRRAPGWRDNVVGLGSVCRRQNTIRASVLIAMLAEEGLRLHAFGYKRTGLALAAAGLDSADSMAWSYDARRGKPLPGCTHRKCANCIPYALKWREETLAQIERAA